MSPHTLLAPLNLNKDRRWAEESRKHFKEKWLNGNASQRSHELVKEGSKRSIEHPRPFCLLFPTCLLMLSRDKRMLSIIAKCGLPSRNEGEKTMMMALRIPCRLKNGDMMLLIA